MRSKYLGESLLSPIGPGKIIAIGFIGGLIGTGAKTICELIAPPRPPGVPSPLGNALDAISISMTGEAMPEGTKSFAEPAVHFFFGAVAGSVYPMIERKMPLIRAGYGALFGFGFWLLAHEIALPLLGFSPSPARMTLWEQGNELVTHIVFGVTLEFVRRMLLRKWA